MGSYKRESLRFEENLLLIFVIELTLFYLIFDFILLIFPRKMMRLVLILTFCLAFVACRQLDAVDESGVMKRGEDCIKPGHYGCDHYSTPPKYCCREARYCTPYKRCVPTPPYFP